MSFHLELQSVKERHGDGKNHVAKFMSYVSASQTCCVWVVPTRCMSTRGWFPLKCTCLNSLAVQTEELECS